MKPKPKMSKFLHGIGKPALSAKPTHGVGGGVVSRQRGGEALSTAPFTRPEQGHAERQPGGDPGDQERKPGTNAAKRHR